MEGKMMKNGTISNIIAGCSLSLLVFGGTGTYLVQINHEQDLKIAEKVDRKEFDEFKETVIEIKTNQKSMAIDIIEIKELIKGRNKPWELPKTK
jgi:hypothetical protein